MYTAGGADGTVAENLALSVPDWKPSPRAYGPDHEVVLIVLKALELWERWFDPHRSRCRRREGLR